MARRNPTSGYPAILFKPIRPPKRATDIERERTIRRALDERWHALFSHAGGEPTSLVYDTESETLMDAILRDPELTRITVSRLSEFAFRGFYVMPPAGRKSLEADHSALRFHFDELANRIRSGSPRASDEQIALTFLKHRRAGAYPDLAKLQIANSKSLLKTYRQARTAYWRLVAELSRRQRQLRKRPSLLAPFLE